MKTTKQLTIILLALTISLTTAIHAELLFSDNFNVTSSGDLNTDLSATGRQSGTFSELGYSWWLNPNGTPPPSVTDVGTYAGKALLGGHCTVTPSRNFTEHGDFSIELDVDIVTNLDTHFFSVGFGKIQANAGWSHPWGMEVLIGKYLGQSVYALSENGISRLQIYPLPGVFTASNTSAKVKVCVLQSGFPPTNSCRVALFINDVAYPLNVTATESQFIHTLAIPPTNNYIVFENANADAALYPMTIDNIVISTLEDNTLDTTAWTGDIDSGLDSSKVYSHAVSFGDTADANINGIIFDGSAGNMSGDGWELKTASSIPLTGPTASTGPNVSPASGLLAANYMESINSSNAGALVISKLAPGLNYKLSLFGIGSEAAGGRKSYCASTSGINLPLLDQDEFGDANGQLLTIEYTAPDNGNFSFSTTPENTSTPAWNWYAFCNEVIAPNAPDAIYATQGAYTDKIHIYWTPVAGSQSYIIYRSDTNNISSTNISWEVATDYYDDSPVAVAQNYYYWVAAANTGGVSSVTGSATGFTASTPPDTPSAIFPNGNTVTSPVQFTASSYNDGNGFTFAASQWQVSSDSGFSSIKWTTGENGPAISSIFASRNSIPDGTNYWRVRYKNSKNTWSNWSESNLFICVQGASQSGIFEDSFNVLGNGDVNLNCNALGRQFGNATPLNYIVSGTTEVGSDSANPGELLFGQNSGISPLMSFESFDKFNIEFDVKLHNFDASTDWFSLSLGNNAQTSVLPENNTGLASLFYADGTFQFYKGPNLLHSESAALPANQEFHVFITTSTENFDDGEPAYCSVFVNGTPVPNNFSANKKYGYTLVDGFVKNYLTMFNYNETGTFSSIIDNFEISAAPNLTKIHPWTNDGDSLIDSTKEYTHLVNISGNDVTINTHKFMGTGILTNLGVNNGDPHYTTSTWALVDADNYLVAYIDANTPVANLSGKSFDLGEYGVIGIGSPAIMLSGLTPNSSNSLFIYSFAHATKTEVTFPNSYGAAVDLIDGDQYGISNGIIIQVDYIADKNGKFSVAAVPEVDATRFFICGFANEETGTQPPKIEVDSILAFGEVVNASAKALTLEIANSGGGVVSGTISNIEAPFSLANTYLALPGTNASMSVIFSPIEERTYTNVITLTGTGGNAEVILIGSGIPEPSLFIIYYLSFIIYYLKRK